MFIKGFFVFVFFRAVSTDSESEMIMNLSTSLDFIMSKAKKMAMVSVQKIEASSGKCFSIAMLLASPCNPFRLTIRSVGLCLWFLGYCGFFSYNWIGSKDVRGVMVIVAGCGHDDTSSNPSRAWLHFT